MIFEPTYHYIHRQATKEERGVWEGGGREVWWMGAERNGSIHTQEETNITEAKLHDQHTELCTCDYFETICGAIILG